MKHALLAVMVAGLLAWPGVALADPGARTSATCSDYSNQAEAQRAADTRDPDGDGVYCESLPCPCAKPGSGGGGGNTSPKPKSKKRKVKRAVLYSARIVSVTDSDTVKVRIAGSRSVTTIRVIGIDGPETRRPGVAVECGGPEASASMKRLAPVGAKVSLRTDPTQDTRDRYGRLLAYVGRNGRDLGRSQVSRGHAKTYVYAGKPFQRTTAYRRSQAKAKRLKRGVYGKCGGDFHSEQAGSSGIPPRAARARTRITAMRMKLRGFNPGADYFVQVALRVRVCGRRGLVRFHVQETSSPPDRNGPVFARGRRVVRQEQVSGCDTHRITYVLADRFFGASRYRVSVRARTSARDWSSPRSRHTDTYD